MSRETSRESTLGATLVEVLRSRAERQGGDLAYTFLLDGERAEAHLTYAELDRRARGLAATLAREGIGGGERVLLLYPPGLDYIAAFFGCLYAGAVAVPAYPPRSRRPSARLTSIQESAGAKAVLSTTAVLSGLDRQLPRRPGVLWLAAEGAELEKGAEEWRDPRVEEEALAFLQYTSGSTAAPKGVMLRHANLLANLEQIRLSFAQTPAERTVIWLPPYHDMGLIGGILTPLYTGNTAVLLSPVSFLQRPLRWLQAISRYRGTTSGGPNFAYDLCVEKIGEQERENLDLSSWTLAFNGAEPVRAATLERFARAFAPCGFRREAFLPCYGLAEGTLLAAVGWRGAGATIGTFEAVELEKHRAVPAADPDDARTLVGCGTAPQGARLLVVDPESGVPRAPGEVGEIWIAGPAVAAGYWGLPEATAESFGARTADGDGPWLRTGDLGFLGPGNELFVTGRSKDLIILRGRNHYPQDIELTVERSHPALRPGCGAAFAVEPPEGAGEERLVIVQEVRREHRQEDPAEAVAAIRRAVADEHEAQVHAVVLLRPATIPKTTSGKIQRAACRARYLDGTLEALGSWQAEAGTEAAPAVDSRDLDLGRPEGVRRWLAAEVAARAGMMAGEIDLGQPLDHYPLDSLAAMELMHAVESRFGVVLSMESLFAGGSLAELAGSILERAGAVAPAPASSLSSPAGREVGDHPLSRGQQSLWFLHALNPEGAAYNVASAVRVRGELDVAALKASLDTLIERHAVLRTTFPTSRGEPVQRVHPRGESAIEEVDAQGWSDHRLADYLSAEGQRPFDLENGPLMRVVLLTRAALEHVLLLSMHHVITDFWSLGLMIDDLALLYPALKAGERVELSPPGLLYTDYVRWQEEGLAGPEGERLWEYWRSRLGGELPVLDLHADRPRPRVQTHEGAALQVHLSPHLSGRLKELGREQGATPFVTLLAAFEVLLHRYTGQEDFLVGTVTAARTRAGFARTLGYFVNSLVLRADVDGDPGFGALLARTRADALGAFEHQDFPFPLLVERLQPERDPSRSPLFQAMFVLQKAQLADGQELTACALGEPGAHADVGGLRLEIVPLEQRIAQFDLTLTLGEVGEAFVASFDYNVQLFDAATVARWGRHFERLLSGIAADPAAPVSELPLLTPEEERQLTVVWNDTGVEYRHEATLPELLAEQAARSPDAVAVISGGGALTYGELDRRANRLARRLRALGVGPESRVAVCLERSPALMVGLIGVLKAGGAYLPIDPETPRGRVAALLESAGVGLVVTEEPLWSPAGPAVLVLDVEGLEVAGEDDSPLAPTAVAGGLACVIHTSGSTGVPKGVLLTHRNLVNLVASFLDSYRPEPADRILPLTALGFASFVGEIFPLLCAGGALVLPDRAELLDVSALISLIERHGISIVSTVPSMMASLNALHDRLPRLRLILVGGEALAAGDVDKLLGSVRIVNGYGLTETSVCSTCHTLIPDDLTPGSIPPIGRPLMNHRVYLLDRHLQPLPVGCPGEIFIAGDGLARGYLGDPGATAGRFLPDPWDTGARMYRTGDLGLLRSDGELVCLGRVDQQVKVRGFRIELAEIESVLALHPGVKESFVTVRKDGGESQLVAYLVPEEAQPGFPTTGELLAYLREKLPDYMVPGALVTLPALPLTPNGKVDLALLPAPDRARPELASAYSAPRSELERTITALWQEELKVETVGIDDNFFDLGGHSLRMARVHARLKEALGREISLIELFQYPTVSSLARHLSGPVSVGEEAPAVPAGTVSRRARRRGGHDIADIADIAIIGMAGRFPGSKSVDELWRNVAAAREGITFFTAEELLAAGVDPKLVENPNYVRAKGILGDVDLFDASFFGLNPREVELMDPQHRLFLECSWEALEHAGWDPERFRGLVGVYAGLSMNTYMIMNLLSHMELVASVDTLQASLGNDKDPMTSRVSYKLNLKGPSVTIQTASSTSLAAVHQACIALLQHDCDMALSGGVSIHLPEKSGYMYQEGGTTARDGHCRAFDASATGFVSGHGAGVVVLKRLDDALAEGDTVYAVIKGSACNNDGSLKVSFMAPSIEGQVDVYRQAYENAGVDPRTVSYIECHGTGTALGDPIEIAALSRVFADPDRRNYCAIGSLKTNIGHLDTAAGVCGLIKAALSLYHGAIPPSLHFEAPNPRIDFAGSPFFVNTELRPWPADAHPRRAGVTSLGMGGTNAHVVLEEAPPLAQTSPASGSRPQQLLLLSAKSAAALERSTARLADHLRQNPGLDLPDVAFTLSHGRKSFQHRRALVASGLADAAAALETLDPERLLTTAPEPGDRPVAFLFPGQGAQYPGMGRGLYDSEPSFRADVDLCCRVLQPHLGLDLRETLFGDGDEAAGRLQDTRLAQPALFVISWATARLWMSWGVRPEAMLGHSIGEYVAACLAGVFSLEDALALVAVRGRLMSQMPPGAMLGVPLPEAEVLPLLGEDLSLAAVNRPAVSVISGPAGAIEELAERLAGEGLACRRLHTSHAFHSRMMEPVLQPFLEQVRRVRLEPPRLPFLSNVTGAWIRPEEAADPAYWVRQLRQAVRFADGVALLLAEPHRILLETGPGNTLSTLARQHPAAGPGHAMVATLRHPQQADSDSVFLLQALARFWLAGGEVDWTGFWAGERRRRVALPPYPFERRRYWVDPLPAAASPRRPAGRRNDPAEWFYVPVWKQSRRPAAVAVLPEAPAPESWLVFLDRCGLGEILAQRLERDGRNVVRVTEGEVYSRGRAGFTVAPGRRADYDALVEALGRTPTHVLHLWNVTAGGSDLDSALDSALDRGFYSLVFLAQALGRQSVTDPTAITVVSNGLCEVTGEEPLDPLKATLLGPVTVIPREYPNLACRSIDVTLGGPGALERTARQILAEMGGDLPASDLPTIAFRGHLRWVREYEPLPLPPLPADSLPRLRPGGVCLITGGLGGIGLELAEYLAREAQARLVLVGRSPFPEREGWPDWLALHDEGDAIRRKIERLLAIEELGGEVLALSADVADPAAMRSVLAAAERRFGAVHGVIHAAGVPGGGLLQVKSREVAERVLAPKVRGALVLAELFAGKDLDLFALTSSITVLLPQVGQAGYVAANAFLDAFAAERARAGDAAVSINWDAWRETGMALSTEVPEEWKARRQESLAQGLSSREGVEAFRRIAASGLPQVVVSTLDLESRRAENDPVVSLAALEEAAPASSAHPRPALATAYVQPQTDLERSIAAVWQETLGVEPVGLHDNFFELGGNSLAGLRLVQRLRERLAAGLSEVSLYEAPTVGALARMIAAQGPGEEALAGSAAPAEQESRQRGERRKARLLGRRGAGAGL
ncbi:MAG TPA: amino acid adenylation domain-containing protein [Thermoanaerobaculia bacterium]|nr:amino acid adenylation domain-containing protein [Thermoanaerobaculia bacterium]